MKIVVVAESGFTRSSINVNLRSAGYSVTEADPTCLFDVLTVLRQVMPHLVVVDHEIPLCNCETLVRIIREDPLLAATPIILIVSFVGNDEAERINDWGQVRIMGKPLQVEVLLQAVQDQFCNFRSGSLDQLPTG